jgi:hypothetical protein
MKNRCVGGLGSNQKSGGFTPNTFSTGQVLQDRLEGVKKAKPSPVRESPSQPRLDYTSHGRLEGTGVLTVQKFQAGYAPDNQLGGNDKAGPEKAGRNELKNYQVAKNFHNKNLKKKNKVSFEDESKYLANLGPQSKSQTHEDPSRNYGFHSGAQGSNAEKPQIQFIKNFKCAQNNELEINTSKTEFRVPASHLNHPESPQKLSSQEPKTDSPPKPTQDKFIIIEPDLSFGKNSEDSQEYTLTHPPAKPYLRPQFTPKKPPPSLPHPDHSIFTYERLEKCSKENHNNHNEDTRDENFKDNSGIFNNSTSFLDKSLFSENPEDFKLCQRSDFIHKSCNSKGKDCPSKRFALTNTYGRNCYRDGGGGLDRESIKVQDYGLIPGTVGEGKCQYFERGGGRGDGKGPTNTERDVE